ncbi:Phosphorylated adapter RNA export protein [Armadillidium vulgare]|nr:Phosphorylated adapter RNA export protein [Armadillidium vulgare]
MMEEREEGELSESDSNTCEDVDVYIPISRPVSNVLAPRVVESSIPSSDDESPSSESDSDSDFEQRPKRRKTTIKPVQVKRNGEESKIGNRKKNNIWANVIQEEELTLEIGGVGLKKLNRKRKFNFEESKKKDKKIVKPRYLADIVIEPDWDSEKLGNVIADALFEQKPELIVRVVEVLGHEKALELYRNTQKMEKEGGMMINNGSRRRTSGGVFLNLLKTFDVAEGDECVNKVEEDGLHLKGLFSDDPGGTKCPGSTPVTSPTTSDNDETESSNSKIKSPSHIFLPLKEVCERAASEIIIRDQEENLFRKTTLEQRQDDMETC